MSENTPEQEPTGPIERFIEGAIHPPLITKVMIGAGNLGIASSFFEEGRAELGTAFLIGATVVGCKAVDLIWNGFNQRLEQRDGEQLDNRDKL